MDWSREKVNQVDWGRLNNHEGIDRVEITWVAKHWCIYMRTRRSDEYVN